MSEIDLLRNKLYEALEHGSENEILDISRQLDNEILKCMKQQFKL